MQLLMSKAVKEKLQTKHNVSTAEVFECFFNRTHSFLEDTREEHLTDPKTNWFVSETDLGRKLKVCFIPREAGLEIKTAYEPKNVNVVEMYYRKATEE